MCKISVKVNRNCRKKVWSSKSENKKDKCSIWNFTCRHWLETTASTNLITIYKLILHGINGDLVPYKFIYSSNKLITFDEHWNNKIKSVWDSGLRIISDSRIFNAIIDSRLRTIGKSRTFNVIAMTISYANLTEEKPSGWLKDKRIGYSYSIWYYVHIWKYWPNEQNPTNQVLIS